MMDNSENCFAGALFFTLVSVGTFLKVDDVAISVAIGIISALIASIFLKMGVNRAADEADEAHQQLSNEIRRLNQNQATTDYSSETHHNAQMAAVNEVADAIRDHFKVLQTSLTDLKILAEISATNKAIHAKLDNLDVKARSEEIEVALRKLADNLNRTNDAITALSESMAEDFKKLSGISAASGATAEEILSELKESSNADDFAKVNESVATLIEKVDVLADLKGLVEKSGADVNILMQVSKNISVQNQKFVEIAANAENSVRNTMTKFEGVGVTFAATTRSLTKLFDDMDRDIIKLTDKFDTYNGLMRATLEQYSNLTDQDVTILEKIAEKINGK